MQRPQTAEEYITIVDNKGREHIQRVEYTVTDVRDEMVYVTVDGLAYARDGKVKGYREQVLPEIWYIALGKKRRDFGL
jgi:hypothetical protein